MLVETSSARERIPHRPHRRAADLLHRGRWVLLRQINWLTADADASLLRVTVNFLTPCLIFDSILGNEALAQPGNIWLPPLIGFGTVALGVPFALALRGATGLRDERARRTFAFVVSTYNYGYVPIPLILALFAAEISRPTLAVLVRPQRRRGTRGLESRLDHSWRRNLAAELAEDFESAAARHRGDTGAQFHHRRAARAGVHSQDHAHARANARFRSACCSSARRWLTTCMNSAAHSVRGWSW